MKPILFPDYKNSILNLSNSLLYYYGCQPLYPTLPLLDEQLKQHEYRNVALILIDALGDALLAKHPDVSRHLAEDKIGTITSVFPPTTVAATTSVLTGLPPLVTGWIGWMQYVREEDRNVVFFTNKDYYDDTTEFAYRVAEKIVPIEQIYSRIEKQNPDVATKEIFPAFREPEHDSFAKEVDTLLATLKEPGRHFAYVYWDKLDYTMHEFGPDADETKMALQLVDSGYKNLKDNLPDDTLVILIADHGQVGVLPIEIRDYEDLWDTFAKMPSLESRATAFFIKPERKVEFERLFLEYFRDKYVLYRTEDALAMDLFGYGTKHPKTEEFLGDYLALAIDSYYFKLNQSTFTMKGQHAGLLAEETLIPLIIHSKK